MPADPLVVANDQVEAFVGLLGEGETGLRYVPAGLKAILSREAWRRRRIRTGAVVEFDSFERFATTPPLEGIGADLSVIRRLVSHDVEALDLLDRACQREPHVHPDVDNVNVTERPAGNAAAYALRKLRRDAPDVHARVLAGELSPHAGMIEAGFRRRPTPLDTLRRAWAKATPDERDTFLAEVGA